MARLSGRLDRLTVVPFTRSWFTDSEISCSPPAMVSCSLLSGIGGSPRKKKIGFGRRKAEDSEI
jgi:hypothetical protein